MVKEDRDAIFAGERRNPRETSETSNHVSLGLCMFCPGSLGPFFNQRSPCLFLSLMTCDSHHLLSSALLTSFYVGSDPLLSMSF